jgi:transcriptional regulator with XRE-family HTH domain
MPRPETPHIRSTVGANILRLREGKGLTQRELATRIGMDPIGISRWERGKTMPRPETVELVAEALGVDVGDIYVRSAA